MTIILVVALALFATTLFFVAARSRRRAASGEPLPLDLQAFRTLTDRDDERLLREKLPPSQFSRVKRQRIAVTFKYVGRISANAAIVLRMAEAARQDADAEVARAAAQVVDTATQIRMQCLLALTKLTLEYMFPSLQLTPAMLAPKYQALRETVSRLGSLQNAQPLPAAI